MKSKFSTYLFNFFVLLLLIFCEPKILASSSERFCSKNRSIFCSSQDDLGNRLLVWQKNESLYFSIFSHQERAWGSPLKLYENATNELNIRNIQLHTNHQSVFVLSWEEIDSDQKGQLLTSTYSLSENLWSSPLLISPPSIFLKAHSLSLNSSGKMGIVWEEQRGVISVIRYATYSPEIGITAPIQISSSDRNAKSPLIFLSDANITFVEWVRPIDENRAILESVFFSFNGADFSYFDIGELKAPL